jgi:glutamyl-tRNA reductase
MFLSRRKNRPMFFIDIAVPRDVDPEMNKLDGIFVYDIDDLQQAIASHVADRRKEAERADDIINTEVERFQARLQTLDVVPVIVSLQEHLELIRTAEIDRVRGRMGQLSAEQEHAIDALTRGIVNKIMHPHQHSEERCPRLRGNHRSRTRPPAIQSAGTAEG